MSLLQQSNRDDYPAAARKHLKDASVLIAGDRYDGTAYLAGYVVECALKTLIQESRQPDFSHDLRGLNSTLRTVAAQADRRTKQMYTSANEILREADILSWKPEMRYQAAHVTHSTARKWLQEAEKIYNIIISGMSIEGPI